MSVKWHGAQVAAKVRAGALRGIAKGIGIVEAEAVRLITQTPKTGRIYRRRGVTHQASAPGEAFANDTGRLLNSRTIEIISERLAARLTFRTNYGLMLEVGTRRMAARPFARPAIANTRGTVVAAIKGEISAGLR